MNCKPGDLAVFVRSYIGNEGKIVRILRLADVHERRDYDPSEIIWATDRPVLDTFGGWGCTAIDSYLRPIRDPGDDAVDESKAWLPPVPLPTINPELIPSKEKA
jgi:hypothetical protein